MVARAICLILRRRKSMEMDNDGWVRVSSLAWWCFSTEEAVRRAMSQLNAKNGTFHLELNAAGSSRKPPLMRA
jgi:hypothetical protein